MINAINSKAKTLFRVSFLLLIIIFCFLSDTFCQTDGAAIQDVVPKPILKQLKADFPTIALDNWGMQEIFPDSPSNTKAKASFFEMDGQLEKDKRVYATYNTKGIELFRIVEYTDKKLTPAALQHIIQQLEEPTTGTRYKVTRSSEIIGKKYAMEKGYRISVEYSSIMGKSRKDIFFDADGKRTEVNLIRSLLQKALGDSKNF